MPRTVRLRGQCFPTIFSRESYVCMIQSFTICHLAFTWTSHRKHLFRNGNGNVHPMPSHSRRSNASFTRLSSPSSSPRISILVRLFIPIDGLDPSTDPLMNFKHQMKIHGRAESISALDPRHRQPSTINSEFTVERRRCRRKRKIDRPRPPTEPTYELNVSFGNIAGVVKTIQT